MVQYSPIKCKVMETELFLKSLEMPQVEIRGVWPITVKEYLNLGLQTSTERP